jgi:hypothetical protein
MIVAISGAPASFTRHSPLVTRHFLRITTSFVSAVSYHRPIIANVEVKDATRP